MRRASTALPSTDARSTAQPAASPKSSLSTPSNRQPPKQFTTCSQAGGRTGRRPAQAPASPWRLPSWRAPANASKRALASRPRTGPPAEERPHRASAGMAPGRILDTADYRRQTHAPRPPVGFVDMTFSADKSLSVAWALAQTAQERETLLDIHHKAVAGAMAYAETQL